MDQLSDLDVAVLEFEASAPRTVGAKEAAIREHFDFSPVRYHQRLNQLLDMPAAVAFNPVLVNRLRRIRSQRENFRRAARAVEG